ncbi:MAG TPA: sigma-70 family RNA polymerase sigma factor [Pyrinomonadaceae bacterium]|nr:sigma-70 family RNA polymerase sigma factor [Pyrinomonadaceae bacterium]
MLAAIADGDSSAFWKVWETYRKYLYTLCLRQMGGSHSDAEDALSRAMIKACDRLPEHAGKITNLKAWLARLTNNLCIDIHRERKRRAEGVENIEEITDADYEALSHSIESPEEVVLRRETRLYLYRLINELPPNLFEPFILHFFHGEAYRDVAVQLNLSNENVRKRIQQARATLRDKLAKNHSGLAETAEQDGAENVYDDVGPFPGAKQGWDQEPAEITQPLAVRLVKVTLPSLRETSFEITLSHRPQQHFRLETLDKYVRSYPRGWKKRWNLACLLYEMGQWEAAASEYRQVLERQPGLIDAYLSLANLYRLMGRLPEAVAVYEHALPAAKRKATRHHIRGLIEVCQGRYEMAVGELQEAIMLEAHDAVHWHNLGLIHLRAGSFVKALQAFDESLKINPNDIVALTYSTAPLVAAGHTKEARQRITRALDLDPENVPALKWLADLRAQRGAVGGEESKTTRRRLRMAMRLAPDTAEVQESQAVYHIFRGEWEKGVLVLREFAERYPNYPAAWLNLSRWLFRTGSAEASAEAVINACALDQDGWEAQQAACEVFTYLGRLQYLRPLVEEMLARFPERWSVWATVAHALVEGFKNTEQACLISARAVQLQPQLAAAWFQHGRVLALSGKHQEAATALEKGWKWLSDEACDKQSVVAALWLGESLRLLGEEERAWAWFERAAQKALLLSAQCPSLAQYRRGQALEALGDRVGATQAYRSALAHHLLYPLRRDAKAHLKRLQARVRYDTTASGDLLRPVPVRKRHGE